VKIVFAAVCLRIGVAVPQCFPVDVHALHVTEDEVDGALPVMRDVNAHCWHDHEIESFFLQETDNCRCFPIWFVNTTVEISR
jgi:hypothetical protein